MHSVTKARGHKTILKNVSLSYFYGAKIGVIGANGSGKPTLMGILAGENKLRNRLRRATDTRLPRDVAEEAVN